jgi:HK97 family phage major capsid protein
VRRTKDAYERYIVSADPTSEETNQIWGVPVLTTIACPAGDGVLLDTSKFGRVVVREPLGLRIGYSGSDFTSNVVRYVAEERLALAIERPEAICHLTDLPTTAVTETKSAKK